MLLAISQKLLDAASNEGATGVTPSSFRRHGCGGTTHVIEWGEGVSSGVIEIEGAAQEDYAGTWTAVATVTFDGSSVAAPKAEYVQVPIAFGAFRHRISGIVLDGTVTTRISGAV